MKKRLVGIMLIMLFILPLYVNAEEGSVKIGDVTYSTLKDAVEAVEVCTTEPCETTTITVLKDHQSAGIVFKSGLDVEVDFGGFTVTFVGPTVGSSGTKTNDMQLLENSTIIFKNGTVMASSTDKSKMVIQNYSDLTLENMVIDGRTPLINYVLSNNAGNVLLKGNTSIYANEGKVAFDVYGYYSNGYVNGPQVTVDTTGVISGIIEVADSDGNFTKELSLVVKNINHEGKMVIEDDLVDNVTIETINSDVYEVVNMETGERTYVIADEEDLVNAPYVNDTLTDKEFEEALKELEKSEEKYVKDLLADIKKALTGKITVSAYDINYGSFIDDELVSENAMIQPEAGKKVAVTLNIPDTLVKVKDGYTRKYSVIRLHEFLNEDGSIGYDITELEAKENKNGTVTFETDKFSTYILVYEDVKNVENPATYDGITLYFVLGVISVVGISLVGFYAKKKYFA